MHDCARGRRQRGAWCHEGQHMGDTFDLSHRMGTSARTRAKNLAVASKESRRRFWRSRSTWERRKLVAMSPWYRFAVRSITLSHLPSLMCNSAGQRQWLWSTFKVQGTGSRFWTNLDVCAEQELLHWPMGIDGYDILPCHMWWLQTRRSFSQMLA